MTSEPSGDPSGPARWGSPEFYGQTMDARGRQPPAAEPPSYYQPASTQPPSYYQPAPAEPPSYYQPAPVEPVVYEAPAPPSPYSPPVTPPLLPPVPPRRQAPRQGGPRRSRSLLIGLITFLAAAAVAAAVVLVAHPFGKGSTPVASSSGTTGAPASPTTSASVSPTASASASASASAVPTQEQAAQNLAGLLSQSVSDRSAIVAAVNDVNTCGSKLSQDSQTFQNAATSRQNLLNKLASLPGAAALPANMVAALNSAWQNSIQADQDFAKWAQDESSGCTSGTETTDTNALAATGPDNQATIDKKTFVGIWNPIATEYQLTTYQWDQL